MGNSTSHPIFLALNELLRSKNLKIKKSTLGRFLEECDTIAPWFAVSGSLTIPSWEKLGRDLDFAADQGTLKAGVRPVWKLVKSCLEDQKCSEAVENGQAALEILQEERSELSHSEKENAGGRKVYPSLKDLGKTGTSSSEEERESEEEQLMAAELRKMRLKERKADGGERRYRSADLPSAPPPYCCDPGGEQRGASRCPQVWRRVQSELPGAFPVFLDGQGQRYHEPLDFKTIKTLAESVRVYGVSASFTISLVESLTGLCITPTDWMNLARACLTSGQYLEWKAFFSEFAEEQAAVNQAVGGPERAGWSKEMLLGQGPYANQQVGYSIQLFHQINHLAVRAWKAIPNRGEVSGNLTKVVQRLAEPFTDFVARMMEVAGRVFGDTEAAMPLIKQLIYEQCSEECRTAITPYKNKGIETWTRVCRELGGPLTNAGLAAAMVQLTRNTKGTSGACFRCGKVGHMKRECPGRKNEGDTGGGFSRRQPGLCPKCKKGKHWADQCRSVKDINGRPLEVEVNGTRPKNATRGPRPQGPQIYGAMENQERWEQEAWPTLRRTKSRGEPLQAQRDWTSVPPPDSY